MDGTRGAELISAYSRTDIECRTYVSRLKNGRSSDPKMCIALTQSLDLIPPRLLTAQCSSFHHLPLASTHLSLSVVRAVHQHSLNIVLASCTTRGQCRQTRIYLCFHSIAVVITNAFALPSRCSAQSKTMYEHKTGAAQAIYAALVNGPHTVSKNQEMVLGRYIDEKNL